MARAASAAERDACEQRVRQRGATEATHHPISIETSAADATASTVSAATAAGERANTTAATVASIGATGAIWEGRRDALATLCPAGSRLGVPAAAGVACREVVLAAAKAEPAHIDEPLVVQLACDQRHDDAAGPSIPGLGDDGASAGDGQGLVFGDANDLCAHGPVGVREGGADCDAPGTRFRDARELPMTDRHRGQQRGVLIAERW